MAPEIRVLALRSPQIVVDALAAEFERRAGYRIRQLLGHADMPIHVRQRIDAGENFDMAFLVPALLDELERAGRIVGETRAPFLRVPIGVAVRSGAPRPDVGSVDAFRRALLGARSVAYLRAGTSGPYLDELFERLGIAAEVRAKATRPETDTVGDLVARGEAELGITASATLIATGGVDVVGLLPPEIQSYVDFEGAVGANAAAPDIARQLVALVTGPEAVNTIRSKGTEPWRND